MRLLRVITMGCGGSSFKRSGVSSHSRDVVQPDSNHQSSESAAKQAANFADANGNINSQSGATWNGEESKFSYSNSIHDVQQRKGRKLGKSAFAHLQLNESGPLNCNSLSVPSIYSPLRAISKSQVEFFRMLDEKINAGEERETRRHEEEDESNLPMTPVDAANDADMMR